MKTTSPSNPPSSPDLYVFVGRFQPFHLAHQETLQQALDRGGHVVVLVGSANEPRSFYNPFYAEERIATIQEAFGHSEKLHCIALESSNYEISDWLARAEAAVAEVWEQVRAREGTPKRDPRVALLGHNKDETTYYLKLFPQWESLDLGALMNFCASDLRPSIFGRKAMAFDLLDEQAGNPDIKPYYDRLYLERARVEAEAYLKEQRTAQGTEKAQLPLATIDFLERFLRSRDYDGIALEYAHVWKGKHQWRWAPYPPIFVTADPVVIQGDSILLVKRNHYPGRGLWALPGGFIEEDEYIRTSLFRELDEETSLDVSRETLTKYLRGTEVFDAPRRSSRGRTITHASLIELPAGDEAFIRDGDGPDGESSKIERVKLADLDRRKMFEDHYAIIHKMRRTHGLKANAS